MFQRFQSCWDSDFSVFILLIFRRTRSQPFVFPCPIALRVMNCLVETIGRTRFKFEQRILIRHFSRFMNFSANRVTKEHIKFLKQFFFKFMSQLKEKNVITSKQRNNWHLLRFDNFKWSHSLGRTSVTTQFDVEISLQYMLTGKFKIFPLKPRIRWFKTLWLVFSCSKKSWRWDNSYMQNRRSKSDGKKSNQKYMRNTRESYIARN